MRGFDRNVIGTVAKVPASGFLSGIGRLLDIRPTRTERWYNLLAQRSEAHRLYLDAWAVAMDLEASIARMSAAHPKELSAAHLKGALRELNEPTQAEEVQARF